MTFKGRGDLSWGKLVGSKIRAGGQLGSSVCKEEEDWRVLIPWLPEGSGPPLINEGSAFFLGDLYCSPESPSGSQRNGCRREGKESRVSCRECLL